MLMLSACSQHSKIKSDLRDYNDRLQSFTNIETAEPSNRLIDLNSPQKHPLKHNIAALSINLREFHAFMECSLNTHIAQRNTALGKVQLPSKRFVYEVNLLKEFDRCIKILKTNKANNADAPQLLQKLTQWQLSKQQQLPMVWSNLITQSSEIYLHLSVAGDFISGKANDNFQTSKQALHYLSETLVRQDLDASELEEHLKELEHSRLLARMWRTQLLIIQQLDVSTPVLSSYLEINQCSTKKQAADIVIMRNIFTLFFVENIQPLASQLNKYHYQLIPILNTLIESPYLPAAFKQYIFEHAVKQHSNYKNSMQKHIQLWQEIFKRCE